MEMVGNGWKCSNETFHEKLLLKTNQGRGGEKGKTRKREKEKERKRLKEGIGREMWKRRRRRRRIVSSFVMVIFLNKMVARRGLKGSKTRV